MLQCKRALLQKTRSSNLVLRPANVKRVANKKHQSRLSHSTPLTIQIRLITKRHNAPCGAKQDSTTRLKAMTSLSDAFPTRTERVRRAPLLSLQHARVRDFVFCIRRSGHSGTGFRILDVWFKLANTKSKSAAIPHSPASCPSCLRSLSLV